VIIYGDNEFMESNEQINNESIVRSRRFLDGNTVMNFLKKILNEPAQLEQDVIQEEFCTEDERNSPKQINFNPKYGKKLTIKFLEDGKCKVIRLKKANHYLANEHLPVWITMKDASSEFHLMHNIMKQLGEFTMYRDHSTSSAVVYFHKIDQLDGVVNNRLYIRKLPGSKLYQVHKINGKYIFLEGYPFYPLDIDSMPNRIELDRMRRALDSETNSRKLDKTMPEVYPELLVAISYDTFNAIEKHSELPFAVATVSHILVVFNAVDMLYERVKSAQVKLNIAGIVIESFENQWGFEETLTVGEVIEHGKRVQYLLDAKNISSVISDYFVQKEKYFPRDSYDFIIYNTRNQLSFQLGNVQGIAWQSGFSYMYPAGQEYDRINLAIQDHVSYLHFAALAHELAHMMNVNHDTIKSSKEYAKYRGSIMLCSNQQCSLGFSWSNASEMIFTKYFKSPASCILRNYPRSLHPPKPRKSLTILAQCQCFGFTTYKKPKPGAECVEPMICLNDDDTDAISHVTELPKDGTPCDDPSSNKVCWNGFCVKSHD
ncbi:hypothetical protein PV325_009953, partial [Microctonus aethiopoides]